MNGKKMKIQKTIQPDTFSKQVFRYELKGEPIADIQIFKMPIGAEILSLEVQNDKPVVYVIANANPEAKLETRYFELLRTGIPKTMKRYYNYVGTFMQDELAFHVFEGVL